MVGEVSYSIMVFFVIFISSCAVNLLKRHFVIQLAGIAVLFTYCVFKSTNLLQTTSTASFKEVYGIFLPGLMGISACLLSMVAGFWLFPGIRKKFKN